MKFERKVLMILFVPIFGCLLAASCRDNAPTGNANSNRANGNPAAAVNANANKTVMTNQTPTPLYTYEIVNTYKHDPQAFTEGLFFKDGFLYESVGREGRSDLRKVELKTGEIKQRRQMSAEFFGEGTTALNGKIYQLTYTDGKCFVYDFNTFEPLSLLAYSGQGWGLTTDGANLIMSNGTNVINFLDPNDFHIVRALNVTYDNGKPLYLINELEFINGEIWANIWHSEETSTFEKPNIGKPDYIARINPTNGNVVGWIDLSGIAPDDEKRDQENTLNGIAYDAAENRIFVTGKQWRKLFEIKIKPKNS